MSNSSLVRLSIFNFQFSIPPYLRPSPLIGPFHRLALVAAVVARSHPFLRAVEKCAQAVPLLFVEDDAHVGEHHQLALEESAAGLRQLAGDALELGPAQLHAIELAAQCDLQLLDLGSGVDEAVRAKYRYFKIKLCGNPATDRARLSDLAALLGNGDYRATLDANEQYQSIADLNALVNALETDKALGTLATRLLYVEQPFARENTWNFDIRSLEAKSAFIIDEADDSYDAFPRAKALGYRGVSSKSCKGLYKSLLNGARAALWNKAGGDFFISAEDLTCQAGLAIQQDNALVAFHGLAHAERNGHHYVNGFANTPAQEAESFLTAHPDLYEKSGGIVRLAVHEGTVATKSLASPGFACALQPGDIGSHNEKHDAKEHVT